MINMKLTENKGHILTNNIVINKKYLTNLQNLLITYGSKMDKLRFIKQVDSKNMEISSLDLENIVYKLFYKVSLILEHRDNDYINDQDYGEEYKRNSQIFQEKYADYLEDRHYQESFISDLFDECLFEKHDLSNIENLLELLANFLLLTNKISKKNDLIRTKEIILEDLKYILSKEDLKEIENKCEKLFSEIPMNLLVVEEFLKGLQKIILNDWHIQITDPQDFKSGQPFKFICHSTSNTNFKGKFKSRYVSTSLLTEEFTDTYRSGYGFIMDTSNIVGASSRDMYINNYTENSENMCFYTSLPPISSVQRIIVECQKLKQEQKKNEQTKPIYSEVVKDGFNPIAIFCLTDGSKNLNRNYRDAIKLQKSFPNLKIIEIDLTLYKSYEELKELMRSLIDNIEYKITSKYINHSDTYYENFEFFFQEYLNFKRNGNYTETDIINLFLKHKEMLSPTIKEEDIFSGKYSEFEINFIFQTNPKFNFQKIFNGIFTIYSLKKLPDDLSKNMNNPILLKLFPNINNFLTLIKQINLEEEIINNLKENLPLDFTNMIIIIKNILSKRKETIKDQIISLKEKQQELKDISFTKKEQFNLQKQQKLKEIADKKLNLKEEKEEVELRLKELIKIKQEKENLLSHINLGKSILNQEVYYNLVKLEYDSYLEKLNVCFKNSNKIEENLSLLKQEKEGLEKEKKDLSRHKFINYFKIKELKKQISSLEISLQQEQSLYSLELTKQEPIKKQLEEIEKMFYEKTSINYLDFSKVLELTKELYHNNDEAKLISDLNDLETEITKIEEVISSLTINYNKLEQEDDLTDLYLEEFELEISLKKIQKQLLEFDGQINLLKVEEANLEEVINISK